MTKTYCDRCGALVEEKFVDMVNLYVYSHEDVNNATHSLDLCANCGEILTQLLKSNDYLSLVGKKESEG